MLAAVLTAGALAATIVVWKRWGFVARPAGVLLIEVLLTLTVGLAVNRSEQFYPSWDALFANADPGPVSYQTSAGRLDTWLAAQPGAGQAQKFSWRPSGWAGWHLAAPPEVTVPAGYLAHPSWRYSVVLVIGAHAWPVPAPAGPTVLVSVTTTTATDAATLSTVIPGELGHDLRVSSHRWALVTAAADNTLARQAVITARGRFPALAFVGTAAPTHPVGTQPVAPAGQPSASPPSASPPSVSPPSPASSTGTGVLAGAHPQHRVGTGTAAGKSCSVVHHPAAPMSGRPTAATPAGTAHPQHGVGTMTANRPDKATSAVHSPVAGSQATIDPCAVVQLPPGVLPSGIATAYFPADGKKADLAGPLQAALDWAAAQTPPPLAASAPEPTYLPPPPQRPHHAQPKPKKKEVKHGSGQPRS